MREYVIVCLLAVSLVALGASAYLFIQTCDEVNCYKESKSVDDLLVEEEFGDNYEYDVVETMQCDEGIGKKLQVRNEMNTIGYITYGCGDYIVER